jgi:hypothetical protein
MEFGCVPGAEREGRPFPVYDRRRRGGVDWMAGAVGLFNAMWVDVDALIERYTAVAS